MRFLLPILVLTSCGPALFDLPEPPPKSEWRSVSLIPGQEERNAEQQYTEVRAQVLRLNSLLSSQRYKEAASLLSVETQDFLALRAKKPIEEVLASGKLQLPNGEVADFDPVPMLLADDVTKLTDTVEGIKESESASRKEVFAEQADGAFKRIIMIREGGKWVLHRTRFSKPIKKPAK